MQMTKAYLPVSFRPPCLSVQTFASPALCFTPVIRERERERERERGRDRERERTLSERETGEREEERE